jgi:nucleotide-binding universal stress UspA family protein
VTLTATDLLRYPKRFLCPTDFSPFSRRALQHAIALALPAGAEITILHVLLLPLPSIDSDDEPDWMPPGRGARSELLEQMRLFAKPAFAAGLTTHLLLREGYPGDEIVRAACALDTDVIVMGSCGRRGLQRLLGSHSEHVLRTARCPVLTVGAAVDATPVDGPVRIQTVLCAASGSEHSPQTVEYARCLATGAQARLAMLHVTARHSHSHAPPPWAGRVEAGPAKVDEYFTRGSPHAEILRCAERLGADLIVIGAPDRPSALGYVGSTAGAVVRDAECAVLTVRAMPSPTKPERPWGDSSHAEVGAVGNPVRTLTARRTS